jgi:hypothetical protein
MSSSSSDLALVEVSTNDRPRHRSPDINKSPTANAIRETRAKLTGTSLRRLREGLFKLQLQLVQDMVTGGVNIARVAAVSDCARALEVVEVLQVGTRER